MKKVVIIGAGPAGLTAAYELLKQSKDYKVIVVEESDSIGGISRTINYKNNRMDIGGHRFFSKDERVVNFWKSIMPIQGKPSYDDRILNIQKNLESNNVDPEKESNVFLKRNRVSRIWYNKRFFDYPISLKFETIKNLGFMQTIIVGFSYLKSCVIKKKEDSLENFYINRFGKKLYTMFFENYTTKVWGRTPDKISADWGAQRVKGLSIFKVLSDSLKKVFHIKNKNKETSLIEEFIYPKYGPGQFWEKVAEEIEQMGGVIKRNHKVIKINKNNNIVNSLVCETEEGLKTIKLDILISSMPIKDLINSFNKDVPKNVSKIANGLPYRDFITIGLLVKKINLENKTNYKTLNNIVPDCWIYVQDKDVKVGRIQIFNNWSCYMVEKPLDTIWLGLEYFCDENDNFWNLSDSEAKDFAIYELEKMNIINKKDVIDYHREKVKKAYPAYFDTYKDINKVIKYLNKIDNLYCIGRNGQHRYNNMDHSMLCSFKAVELILKNKKSKKELWNINTENKYHEKITK